MPKSIFPLGLLVVWLAACSAAPTAQWQALEITVEAERFVTKAAPAEALETLSFAEAQARLPFALALPQNVPADYELAPEVEVISAAQSVSALLTWQNADDATLTLQVTNGAEALGLGRNPQIATVHEQRATLTQSGSLNSERWSLTWARAGLTYTLAADTLAPDVLVTLAESIP
jgi:hypothetical protein